MGTAYVTRRKLDKRHNQDIHLRVKAKNAMRQCNDAIRKTLDLVERMTEVADEGDRNREDTGCGVLFGVLRDSAYKIKKLAEEEREAHVRKGWWPKERPGGDRQGKLEQDGRKKAGS